MKAIAYILTKLLFGILLVFPLTWVIIGIYVITKENNRLERLSRHSKKHNH